METVQVLFQKSIPLKTRDALMKDTIQVELKLVTKNGGKFKVWATGLFYLPASKVA